MSSRFVFLFLVGLQPFSLLASGIQNKSVDGGK